MSNVLEQTKTVYPIEIYVSYPWAKDEKNETISVRSDDRWKVYENLLILFAMK